MTPSEHAARVREALKHSSWGDRALASLAALEAQAAEMEKASRDWPASVKCFRQERDAALAQVAELTAELEDERLAFTQQRAAYVEMRQERDDMKHGRDLARLDTEREREETHAAFSERNKEHARAERAEALLAEARQALQRWDEASDNAERSAALGDLYNALAVVVPVERTQE